MIMKQSFCSIIFYSSLFRTVLLVGILAILVFFINKVDRDFVRIILDEGPELVPPPSSEEEKHPSPYLDQDIKTLAQTEEEDGTAPTPPPFCNFALPNPKLMGLYPASNPIKNERSNFQKP